MSMLSDNQGGIPARYGDGRTAASRPVRVRLTEMGLEIAIDDATRRLWPYAQIEAAAPLDRRSGEALLHRVAPPGDAEADAGATLFIADRELVQGLIARHGHLTAQRERWRFAKPGLAAAAVIGAITLGIWVSNFSPSRAVASIVPQSLWEKFGTQMLAGLAKGHRECTAPEGVAALDRLMRRLVEGDYRSQGFEAKVVEWNLLNAFAMPGRRLVLTSRLIETAGSAEEIAGVLAHEIGHGIERHPETAIVRVLGLATLAKLFASGIGDTVSNASVLLVQLRYNRDGEREADQRAVELLQAAEIRVKPLATFLLRIKKTYGGSGSEPLGGILSTHPDIDERIARIDALADAPARPAMTPADLAALRAICKR